MILRFKSKIMLPILPFFLILSRVLLKISFCQNQDVYVLSLKKTELHCELHLGGRTQFSRALLLMPEIQRAHNYCKNKHAVNRVFILFTQHPHYLRYFSLLLNTVYWWP